MAKKQKSKLLAMALCASVMAGLYANPVFAGDVVEESITGNNSGLSFTIDRNMNPAGSDAGGIYFSGSNGVSGQIYGHLKIGGEKIAGALIGQSLNLKSMSISTVDGDETITETITVENIKNWNNAAKANENVAGIRREGDETSGGHRTIVEEQLVVNRESEVISNLNASFTVDSSGNLKASTFGNNIGTFSVNEDGVVTAADVTVDGHTGGFNVTGQNDEVVSYLRAGDLRINDFSSWNSSGLTVGDFKISKNNSNYIVELNQHGGGSVFKADGAAGTVEAAGVKFESNNITLADEATVDGVDVSEVAHNVDGIRRYNVRDGKGTTVTEDTLFVDGVSQRVYTRGDIYSSGDFVTVDENGEKYSLNNIGDKTAGISQHKWNTTYFEGAISATGSVSAGGVGDEAKIGGNTKDGGYLQLKDANDQYQKLTADKLATINTVITDEGEVNSRGDVTSTNGTKNYSLNTVGANTAGIRRTNNGTNNVTIIEENLKVYDDGTIVAANENFKVNKDGNVFANAVNIADGTVVISEDGINAYDNKFTVNPDGGITAVGGANLAEGMFTASVGGVTMANGNVQVDTEGNIVLKDGLTVDGVDVSELNESVDGVASDVQHIKHYDDYAINGQGYDATVIEESVAITKDRGVDVIGGNGANVATITRQGNARFGAETGANVRIQDGGVYVNENYQNTVASLTGEGLTLGEQTLTEQKISDIEGITRDAETGTTTIEGATSFDENGMNVGNGAVVANTDGSFSAANGAFTVEKDGTIYARQDDATFNFDGNNVSLSNGGNSLSITDNALTLSSGANSKLQLTQEGLNYNDGALTVAENGTLKIHGDRYITLNADTGVINAADFTTGKYGLNAIGDSLGELQEDFDTTNANVAGIERIGEGAPGEGITTIEDGALFVSKDVTYMNSGDAMVQTSTDSAYMSFGDNMISVNKGGINLVGSVGFTGHDGGRYTLSDLEGRVYDLEQKTEHITVDEAGNTTISSPNGDTTLTVTDEGVNIEGNGNVGGDATVSGNLDVEGTVTAPTGDFDKVTADEATVGNTHIGENGVETDKVTVTGADGSVTTIDGGTITTGTTNIKGDSVYSENGYFDNLNSANGGTIGGVKLEGNTVDADKVVTGNTTLDNEGLNVGGQTSVTADGVNVGGNGGTTVDKDGVSIADSTIISDHDVVINEGTDERVSLADVGNRVGNLEQGLSDLNSRVDKLDDRIDKVGAMAAAIANLRTMGYDPAAPTEVAVGLGQYRDETGAALGLFHYPNRDFMLSLSVSTSGDEVMGGIGATWKFGRKSPEKVAEIKKAQAEADVRRAEAQKLAKAEELKAAAKEAKIKAQMERHAKLAAERAAEAEAK